MNREIVISPLFAKLLDSIQIRLSIIEENIRFFVINLRKK